MVSQAWWYMLIILATQEREVGGLILRPVQAKMARPLPQKQQQRG
jgi:hypothetical protein